MTNEQKRFLSVNELNRAYGIPITMTRRRIKQGLVPGFYSGTWFHVDVPAYLEMLKRESEQSTAT